MHKTRKEAKACGATHYFTGKQCKNGHIEVRIVSCGTCLACAREKTKKWASLNRDRHLSQKKAGRERRSEKIAIAMNKWRLANKGKRAAKEAARRAMIKERTVFWANEQEISMWYEAAEVLSRGGVKFHVDHIVPLKGENVCGLHTQDNLQILPWYLNLQKGNRAIEAKLKEKNGTI